MKTAIVIPARELSKRLALKHLYPLFSGLNTLELLEYRIGHLKGATRILAVGQRDTLYEAIGKQLGYEVFRTGAVQDGDLLGTFWEVSQGFDRVVVVYGDSPLVDAELVNRLLEHTGSKEFGWVEGVRGLRPFTFTRDFLVRWRGRIFDETKAPFSLARWPGAYHEPLRLLPAPPFGCDVGEGWALDTRDDLRRIREFLSAEGIGVSLERILECSR